MDESAEQQKHAVACGSNFPLLSDQSARLVDQLGIKNERGMARRVTYVLDKEGKVRRVFNDVKVDGHTDEVLAAVREVAR